MTAKGFRSGAHRIARWILPSNVHSLARSIISGDNYAEVQTRLRDISTRVEMLGLLVADDVFGPRTDVPSELNRYEISIWSQNGEDGILLRIFARIGTTSKRFVEIGIGDGHECNTRNLSASRGWTGLLLEAEKTLASSAKTLYAGTGVEVVQAFVSAESANDLLRKAGMTGPIDLLSIDVDGNDYWLLEAIEVVDPRVVVVEYNASFGPARTVTIPYDPGFTRHPEEPMYHGASLGALCKLATLRGYRLVGCDSCGVNAFFVKESELGELEAMTPAEAWMPHSRRCRRMSQQEQERRLLGWPVIEV